MPKPTWIVVAFVLSTTASCNCSPAPPTTPDDAGSEVSDDGGMPSDTGPSDAGIDAGTGTENQPESAAPNTAAVTAAASLQHELPGASVHFSANTGEISAVVSSGVNARVDRALTPLVESRGTDETARESAMIEFFDRFALAFNLTNGPEELKAGTDPVNDPQRAPPGTQSRDLGAASGLKVTHLHRMHDGVRVYGQFATGVFDGQGNLQAVLTRLLPMSALLEASPMLTAEAALKRVVEAPQAAKILVYTKDALPRFVHEAKDAAPAPDEHSEELIWLPIEKSSGRLGSPKGSVAYRLVYDVRTRHGASLTRAWVDAQTGELVDHRSDTPSGWWDQGQNIFGGANDEIGAYQIFLCLLFNDRRYMAATGKTSFAAKWLSADAYLAIDNLYVKSPRNKFYAEPISIPATVSGVDNYWNNDTTFNANDTAGVRLRQSAHLMVNLTRAQDWWAARNWIGWDNQGSTFNLAIGMKKSEGADEDLNAWGGNGTLAIGGASTPTGQYLGSSMEIVGHEYTHNFITATSALEYHDEPGAINEGLADIFGKAITSQYDTFKGTTIGGDVGLPARDVVNPPLKGQPDRYSNYVVTKDDNNGVHTNSGIVNKAHALLVLGGTFGSVTVPAVGMAEVEKILRLANVYRSFPTTASMEEFANGVLDMCRVTDAVNQVFGDVRYGPICRAFKKAYQAVEILPRWNWATVRVSWVRQNVGTLAVGLANHSYASADVGRLKATIVEAAGSEHPAKILKIVTDGPSPLEVAPAEAATITLELPEAFSSKLPKAAPDISVRLEQDGRVLANDMLPLVAGTGRVGSDYVGSKLTVAYNPDQSANLSFTVENRTGAGYPEGLGVVLLQRTTASGALSVLTLSRPSTPVAIEGTLATDVPVMGAVTVPLENEVYFSAPNTISLPTAAEIPDWPGHYQVWFTAQGGLPELDRETQLYALVDPRDTASELNETNNLVCLNCRAVGQAADDTHGVIVRLPAGVAVDALFPADFQPAAAKLRTDSRKLYVPQRVLLPRLNYRPTVAPR
jgi:hypothetical protein